MKTKNILGHNNYFQLFDKIPHLKKKMPYSIKKKKTKQEQ